MQFPDLNIILKDITKRRYFKIKLKLVMNFDQNMIERCKTNPANILHTEGDQRNTKKNIL